MLVGVAGYWYIGDGEWPLVDCAYMVLITITTVGYDEVLPVSDTEGGRLFTMALLVMGMGVSLYFVSALTAFIIEGDLNEVLWRRRMAKKLHDLDRHFVVCGVGRTGHHVVDELMRSRKWVVVIDADEGRLSRLLEQYPDQLFGLLGDATEEELLNEAGVARAAGLVTTLHTDRDNVYVALTARELNPDIRIVSRGIDESAIAKLCKAGANSVVSPNSIGGARMAQELLRPHVTGFFDLVVRDARHDLWLEELYIPSGSKLDGVPLSESGVRELTNAMVLAVVGVEPGDYTYNPGPGHMLHAGQTIVVLGDRSGMDRLRSELGLT